MDYVSVRPSQSCSQELTDEGFIQDPHRLRPLDVWQSQGVEWHRRTLHYDDWKPYAVVLGAPEQKEAHSGDNIAGQVISTLKDFGITADRLGYFMLDNASNNDTAMEAIAAEYGFDVEKRRLRCAGHIINLIARSLLYGFDKTLFEEFEEELNLPQSMEEELEIWRRCGPIGKAHNLIVWIYASPQRVARWHEG